MKTWKIAIVGCGDIAEYTYMPEMPRNERVKVVACCDLIPERTAAFMKEFKIPSAYHSIDDMLKKCDFDILMDTASIPSHYELNMKALAAGKHLYSQKPISTTVQQATDLIELSKRKGVKFSASPVHMLRPDIQEAKRLIASGAIGKVLLIRSMVAHGGPEYFQYRVNDPSWFYRPGAGALYDLGVHALHIVTGIMGPAHEVSCTATISQPLRTIRSGNHDGKMIKSDILYDNYMININFGQGTLANIITGYCVKGTNASELEIYGELGTIHFTESDASPLNVYYDNPARGIRGWVSPQPQTRPEKQFYHCSCIADLVDAIEQDRMVGLPPEHARHVIELMCAIETAAKDGSVQKLSTTF